MLDAASLLSIACTFFIAGAVKGMIGLGLPTVSLALLSIALDLHTAMALLIVPSFVTNLRQAMVGGHGGEIVRRTWPFLATATITVWVGAAALTRVDPVSLTALLGALLFAYSSVGLAGLRLAVPDRHRSWIGAVLGSVNGLLAGMTGSFVVPGVMFLQALGLSRDALVQAMGILFTVSTVSLAGALRQADLLSLEHGVVSALAVAPAMLGMALGQRIRKRLPERTFRRIFLFFLALLGAYLAAGFFGQGDRS
jgi:hypothetical protein